MTPEQVFSTIAIWAPLAIAVLSAINAATKHYTRFNGWVGIVLALIERLSFLTSRFASTGAGRLKLPGTSVEPDLLLETVSDVQKQRQRVARN